MRRTIIVILMLALSIIGCVETNIRPTSLHFDREAVRELRKAGVNPNSDDAFRRELYQAREIPNQDNEALRELRKPGLVPFYPVVTITQGFAVEIERSINPIPPPPILPPMIIPQYLFKKPLPNQ